MRDKLLLHPRATPRPALNNFWSLFDQSTCRSLHCFVCAAQKTQNERHDHRCLELGFRARRQRWPAARHKPDLLRSVSYQPMISTGFNLPRRSTVPCSDGHAGSDLRQRTRLRPLGPLCGPLCQFAVVRMVALSFRGSQISLVNRFVAELQRQELASNDVAKTVTSPAKTE
jgi:hypothetical protein